MKQWIDDNNRVLLVISSAILVTLAIAAFIRDTKFPIVISLQHIEDLLLWVPALMTTGLFLFLLRVAWRQKKNRRSRASKDAELKSITTPVDGEDGVVSANQKLQRLIQEPEWLKKKEPLLSDVVMRKWKASSKPITLDRLREFLKDCFPDVDYHPEDARLRALIKNCKPYNVRTVGVLYKVLQNTVVRRRILRPIWTVEYAFYEINRGMAFLYPPFLDISWPDISDDNRNFFDAVREHSDWGTQFSVKQLTVPSDKPIPDQITFGRVVKVSFPGGSWQFNPNHGAYKIVPDGDIDGYVNLKPPRITESAYPLVREAKEFYRGARERQAK